MYQVLAGTSLGALVATGLAVARPDLVRCCVLMAVLGWVIAFSDDLMCPPHLSREVAGAIPDCDYVEIGGCGHAGYLERPDEVNSAIIEFLRKN